MSQLQLFHFESGEKSFEDFAQSNGETFWWGSDFMSHLGYETWASFNKLINKSMTACNTLNIPIMENFRQIERVVDGHVGSDFKLSRFACYLIAMNGNTKKPAVARAQAYFATLAGAVENYMAEVNNVDRVVTREEISESERSLSGIVKYAGIQSYPLFQNAGYRGMYNMNMSRLRKIRGIPDKRSPLDFMGKAELAANLFRITQTELTIKEGRVKGQRLLEDAAESVGQKVRKTMEEISGVLPEQMMSQEDIKEVRKQLKGRSKELKKSDSRALKSSRGGA